MKKTQSLALAVVAAIVFGSSAFAEINLVFDGSTTGGWTTTDGNPLDVTQTINGTPVNGIVFEDEVLGYSYYAAPSSLISGLDLTGEILNFNLFIADNTGTSVLADETNGAPADLRINGVAIANLDIVDESQLGTIQTISVDFTDPVFSGIDLTNITELSIRAEYWKSGPDIDPIESYLLSVPEPTSLSMIGTCLLGLVFVRRKK